MWAKGTGCIMHQDDVGLDPAKPSTNAVRAIGSADDNLTDIPGAEGNSRHFLLAVPHYDPNRVD